MCKIKLLDKTKHHGTELKKELNILMSKIYALEASTTDSEKKALMSILSLLKIKNTLWMNLSISKKH